MRISPLALLFPALLAVGAVQAADKPITLRVQHPLPSTSSAQKNLIEPWCAKVREESNNRLQCQIYPAMQLGGTPAQLIDQVRDGVVDVIWTTATYASGRYTKSEVFELPWITRSAEASSKALWSYVQDNAMDEFKGVRPVFLHLHEGALLHFADGKKPEQLEDLKSLKLRAPTRLNSRSIEALGATPVQMPMAAVPESMAKKVIDGILVPWESAPAIRLQELAKYHVDVPAGQPRLSNTIFLFGMNPAKYDSLPDDLKAVIDANSGLDASGWAGRTAFDDLSGGYRDQIVAAGGEIHYLPQAEYERWVAATEPVQETWFKEVAAKGGDGPALLRQARELVERYEAERQ
ncbi:TRAP transporter substrate-binding protein [Kerstersia similis]|uniref:TRAP transporter substrate-binding protein n=1 Tax=Kerstersia similis TaxID=206505 RepID=UPI0039EE78F4